MTRFLGAALAALFLALPAYAHSNAPSKAPPPARAVQAHGGRVYNRHCDRRILQLNDRGKCVRALQWLLGGNDPAVRPAKHAAGPNHNRRYWRIRPGKQTGVDGLATVKQTQTVKWRLGYPSDHANGAAGPKLHRFLLGKHRLPMDYRDRENNRYHAWLKARHKPSKIKRLLALAVRAIELNRENGNRFYYTQGAHRSDFLHGVNGPYPEGGDCSGSISALYKLAGLGPTGSAFPYDWTGSMQDRGTVVWRAGEPLSNLHPGDLIFFGRAPTFSHVTLYLGAGRTYSFGSSQCPCNEALFYRSDAVLARRYRTP